MNNLYRDLEKMRELQEQQAETLKKSMDELKIVANRLFSTEDGKKYAQQMIRACHLLEVEQKALSEADLRRLQAQKDFVNLFVTRLVDREVFINIIKEI